MIDVLKIMNENVDVDYNKLFMSRINDRLFEKNIPN